MQQIVKMQFGSQVYGTSLPSSDTDYKGIYVPARKDILLQRVQQSITKTTKQGNSKNSAEDIDFESYSLQKYLKLVCEGQTVAIDMLFVPESFIESSSSIWAFQISANKQKLLSKKIGGFVAYCKTQANKYGIKGSRIASLKKLIEVLTSYRDKENRFEVAIFYYIHNIMSDMVNVDHFDLITDEKNQIFLQCCNRKMPLKATFKSAIEVYSKVLAEYGIRAKQAESNKGVDWKALMHAVRIGNQAKELLQTGHITFPRPEAKELLAIRQGEVPYVKIANQLEETLEDLPGIAEKSDLLEQPDFQFCENLIL